MQNTTMQEALQKLGYSLSGDLHYDHLHQVLYGTDASVYRELPLGVAMPKNTEDIQKLVAYARDNSISLIPRGGGTSLAGQVVGSGMVVDVGKYMNRILEFNAQERWVRVEPGVVRDELNAFLQPHGLFFSPITSTANRAMVGGMIGNNSCGQNSIVYGSVRDKLLSVNMVVCDGIELVFSGIGGKEFQSIQKKKSLEGKIYRHLVKELCNDQMITQIKRGFPKASVTRRNTGYAVDEILKMSPFTKDGQEFNMSKLIAGSEGTLGIITEATLLLDPLPDPFISVVAIHCQSIRESLQATQHSMTHRPTACEIMDKVILDCTKENITQRKNRSFVIGDPAAILLVEFRDKNDQKASAKANNLIDELKKRKLGYAYPIIQNGESNKVWELRKAGLGLLANIPGDKKAVACIEDTAVDVSDLPDYIAEFDQILAKYGQKGVYYAHAGAGEIHLRPILDLKKSEDVRQFYQISKETAELVKKYQGALSGEHGDGRLRAPFIPLVMGNENYQLFKRIKDTWDPLHIFNPGKIVDALPMTESLRYIPDQPQKTYSTIFDFSKEGGILKAAEKCNGSGDCRKLPASGGTMCPSYQATRNEKDTTRGRANVLREFLTQSNDHQPFNHLELKDVMDLCLSCKGCTSECPSNVDMASMKAEFLYQFYKVNGVPRRARFFASFEKLNTIGSKVPRVSNFFIKNKISSGLIKKYFGIASKRSLPTIANNTLNNWYRKNYKELPQSKVKKEVYLFCDEFTNYGDANVGIKAIQLLSRLGYQVKMIDHPESGRAAISKGILDYAQKMANRNVEIFSQVIGRNQPLIGIEPSAILSFRDEYPRLVDKSLQSSARQLANHVMTIEEFLFQEMEGGEITSAQFTSQATKILLHGHCHQKSLSSQDYTAWILSLPVNYEVEIIPSGCCGMAGSFGYEKEHFRISQQIGELVLFPAIRKSEPSAIIVAPGTSCRHQIKDGVGKKARHPVEILWEALVVARIGTS